MSRFFSVLFALITLTLFSCQSTRHADRADTIVETPPTPANPIQGLGAEQWCSDFGMPGLERAIARSWEQNMQLRAAWSRLAQAEATTRIVNASRRPRVDASGELSYSNRNFGPVDAAPRLIWAFEGAASYEIDLWGRLARRTEAAGLDAEAIELDGRALAITLTSQVAEAWFDVIAQQARLRLLEAQLEVSQDTLNILELRARRGVASALDLAQQRQNTESIRGQIAEAQGALDVGTHRLATLLGQPPDTEFELPPTQDLPELPALVGEGIPLELMQRRPDVRAAYLRLHAADARTAAAVADRLPRLRLSTAAGFQGEPLVGALGQLFWSLASGIAQPIYRGGELKAEVERSEAVAEEQLYLYADVLLEALREGEDAIALEQAQRARLESLNMQLATSQQALELARMNYRAGAVDYLRVLTALQTQQQVERTLLDAQRTQLTNRIRLCRALGGTWVEAIAPTTRDEAQEE